MPAEPSEKSVTVTVSIDGSALPATAEVFSIVVRQAASRPARLELVAKGESAGAFKVGSRIEVSVERRRSTKLVIGSARGRTAPAGGPLFSGTVQSVTDRLEAGSGSPQAVVVAEDALARLRNATVSAVFERQKAAEIVSQVVSNAGLTCQVPPTAARLEQYVVFGQSAFDVCMQLAAGAGWLFHCDKDKVVFTPADAKPAAALSCKAGESLLHFSGGTREVPAQVTYRSWDIRNGTLLESQAPVTAQRKGAGVVRQSAAQAAAVLSELAQGAARECSGMSFVGAGSIAGSPLVRVGAGVEVKGGSGTSFPEGTYLVTACEHRVEAGDFITNFSVGLSEPLPRPARVAAPLLVGTVVKNFDDPENVGRVQVQVGTMEGASGIWAHPAVPFGGFHFPHDIGDQVLLGFLGDDLALPVVLGGIPSQKDRDKLMIERAEQGHRGAGQIAYGKALLKMAPGDVGPASASLSGPAFKVEVVEGSPSESKVQLAGPGNTKIALSDGRVSLEVGPSRVDLDATDLNVRVAQLEAHVQNLLDLRAGAAMRLQADGRLDLKSAVVSINQDALKIV